MVKVNFIASFLLAIVMLTSCSNVAKKSIEDLTVENIQGTLLHPDDKCIGAYPRLITQDFWLSQVYRDDVNCCICVQDGDSLLAKRNVFNRGKGRGEYDEVSFALSSDGALGVLNYANGNQLLSFSSAIPCIFRTSSLSTNFRLSTIYAAETPSAVTFIIKLENKPIYLGL